MIPLPDIDADTAAFPPPASSASARPDPAMGLNRPDPAMGLNRLDPAMGLNRPDPATGFEVLDAAAGFEMLDAAAGFELEDRRSARRVPSSGRGQTLFGEDFDRSSAPEPPAEPEIIEPTFTLAEYEAGREEARRAGQAAEREAIRAAEETEIATSLAAIAAHLGGAQEETARIAEDSAEAIARLLLDTLGALFPVLCARFGAAEAEGVMRAILPALRQEPRATIRLAPTLVRRITGTIEKADPDLLARMDFIADEALPAGDLRVTWRSGEARRDAALLWTEIGDVLGQAGWPTVPARMLEMTDVE